MASILDTLETRASAHPPSLPLKLLVVAECTGNDHGEQPLLVREADISVLLDALRPVVEIDAENRLQKGGPRIRTRLQISRMEDFHPSSLVEKIPSLAEAQQFSNPALSDQLDEILHQPGFQSMESCWRGLERLVFHAAAKPGIQLEVVAASRRDLKDRFHKQVLEPEFQGLVEIPLSAVYFDFRFSHEPVDLPLLEALAADCEALQVPLVAAVSPAFFQLKNLIHLPSLPDIAGKLQSPAYTNWRNFQTSSKARWVCLTANRYLARETYNLSRSAGDPIDYVERADAAHPERYLWADAGWLVFSNLARSFAKYRHCVVIDGMSPDTAHNNLPVRPFPKIANVQVPSPTEILIDDAKAWDVVRGGVTMLMGISNGAVATFPLLATVHRLRPGVMTTESALSYQLFAGHLSHYLLTLYEQIPIRETTEAVTTFVQSKLQEFLIPFAGETPEECVQAKLIEPAGEAGGRLLSLTIKPHLKIQGRNVDFTLQLSL